MSKRFFCFIAALLMAVSIGCSSPILKPDTLSSLSFNKSITQSDLSVKAVSASMVSTTSGKRISPVLIRLSAYGGKADGKTDNIKAMQAALSAARNVPGKKIIVLDKGRYIFSPSDYTSSIVIKNIPNLEIRGKGKDKTHIIINNPKGGFVFAEKCENITFSGFSVDWDPLPFTQGVIIAKNDTEGTFDLKIDKGFPSPDGAWYTDAPIHNPHAMRWGVIIDPSGKGLKRNTFDHLFTTSKVTKVSEGVYRMYAEPGHGAYVAKTDLAVGDKYVQITRFNDGAGITFGYCKNTLVQNVVFYSSPGMCIVNLYTDGAIVRDTSITIKPRTKRFITSNGDGFHFGSNKTGPIVEDCNTEGMCDDAINIGQGYPINIIETADKRSIITEPFTTIEKGHEIMIFNPREGTIKLKAKVTNKTTTSTLEGKSASKLTLDVDIPDIVLTSSSATSDYLLNPEVSGSGFIIRNNRFGPQRVRSIFIQTHSGIIENNIIDRSGGYGMFITNEAIYPSAMFPYNITVKNNIIKNSGVSRGMADMPSGAAVLIKAQKYPVNPSNDIYPTADGRITKNIVFTGNKIINPPSAALFIGAAKNVLIENNEITAESSYPTNGNKSLIVLDNCEGVKIKDNTLKDEREGTIAGLHIKNNVAQGNEGVTIDNLKTILANNAKSILDERR